MNTQPLIPPQAIKPTKLERFHVYRGPKSREYLCVCAARHQWHAVEIARQLFDLGREAFAIREGASRW